MLRLQISTPENGKLKFLIRFLQNFNGFGIGETLEIVFHDTFQLLNQLLIEHFLLKFEIISAIIERIFNKIFQKIFGQIHVIYNVVKCHFRLNHPEFCQVTRGV